MKSKVIKTEKRWLFVTLIIITSILAFLAGYGFQKFVNSRSNLLKDNHQRLKRSIRTEGFIEKRNFESRDRTLGDVMHEEEEYHKDGMRRVNTTYIQTMHKYFSADPHSAGTTRNNELAQYMSAEWRRFGFDRVELKDYDVLLAVPAKPAVITLYDEDGTKLYDAKTTEDAFPPEENNPQVLSPFNAYSASGDIEAEYIYVNYGEVRDYIWLKEHNVNVTGKILIAKYGFAFRGEKARLAEQYGALGLILYPDPEDNMDAPDKPGYPVTWDMPPGGIPRGNILNVKGDPLTPGYPAKDGMFRIKLDDVPSMIKIPVTPISYGAAHELLRVMDGIQVPDPDWQGELNFTYHITSRKKRTLKMIVDNVKERKKIYNVVATINGDVEPDRLVLIGNHRDAWVYGAGDPSSGTACLMEIARSISLMLKDGWRPRRTIMIISWDAEEYGLIGSHEWVEEYTAVLSNRAVVYINVDIGVSGNYTLRAKATLSLHDKLFEVTRKFPDPDSVEPIRTRSLYEMWKDKVPSETNIGEPKVKSLGSGSDFTTFYSSLGIACIDLRYTYNEDSSKRLNNYPVYHTLYDNHDYYKKFVDPYYKYHTVVTKVILETALEFADDIILPFNISRYARQIIADAASFQYSFQEMLLPHDISMDDVKAAAESLLEASLKFHKRLKDVNKHSCLAIRRVNDQLMMFERAFITPEGLPGRKFTKHVLYSPARQTLFSRKTFPGLIDLLYKIETKGRDNWDDVRQHLSVIVSLINHAEQIISDFGKI